MIELIVGGSVYVYVWEFDCGEGGGAWLSLVVVFNQSSIYGFLAWWFPLPFLSLLSLSSSLSSR